MALVFTLPEDYNPPSGTKEGVEFSDIATFKFDGKDMMLLSVGEDKTPILNRGVKEDESTKKPKGAKQAVKEQLMAMEDKKGSAEMEDSGEQYAEGGMEE
jgi:hypothetical protein